MSTFVSTDTSIRTAGHDAVRSDDPPKAGDQPLPGYRLIDRLGRGGSGEVWRCEAPGGLHKAIKYVYGDSCHVFTGTMLERELEAVRRVKAVRHPFLISLERVETVGRNLVVVMELADGNLDARFQACMAGGRRGIPRAELLRHIADAAEALDVLADGQLQHLDVKPANLFLVGGRVKLGDYGLVSRLASGGVEGGFTPKYVSPERVAGKVDPRSDQYSLALVYHELLTGEFPYPNAKGRGVLVMHAMAEPDLSALSPNDRAVVAKALSKTPADRFASCREFVKALTAARQPVAAPTRGKGSLEIRGVVHVGELGRSEKPARPEPPTASRFGLAVYETSGGFGPGVMAPDGLVIRPDGTQAYRFRTHQATTDVVAALSEAADASADRWGGRVARHGRERVVFRLPLQPGGVNNKAADFTGVEIDLRVGPTGWADDEVWVIGRAVGPDPVAEAMLPQTITDVCGRLQNLLDRRRAPRIPYDGPVVLHPLAANGVPLVPVAGRVVDLSPGGVCYRTDQPVAGKLAYATFPGVGAVSGWAVLVETLRTLSAEEGAVAAGRIRTDLDQFLLVG